MNIKQSLSNAFEIAKLNTAAIEQVVKDENATSEGITILVIAGLMSGLPMLLKGQFFSLIFTAVGYVIIATLLIGLLHLTAILLGGSTNFMVFYRVVCHAWIIGVLNVFAIIPIIGKLIPLLTTLGIMAICVVIVENVHGLSTPKSIAVVIIPTLLRVVIFLLKFFAIISHGILKHLVFL